MQMQMQVNRFCRKPVTPRERKMQSAMEKLSNAGSVAKEKLSICRAKIEENVEKSTAKTKSEKRMVKERRKAKEAEASRDLHEAKARHAGGATATAAATNIHHHHHQHQVPVDGGAAHHLGLGAPTTVSAFPVPEQGHRPGHKF